MSANELIHVFPSQPSLQGRDALSTHTSAPVSETALPDPVLGPSSFRNVSACNRCRLRKHRCDQQLPRCHSCERAQVRCVGYDPITKQETPRSYVHFLENRVKYLNTLLSNHGIELKPIVAFDEYEANGTYAAEATFAPAGSNDSGTLSKTAKRRWGSYGGKPSPNDHDAPRDLECAELSDGLILDLLFGRTTRREILRLGKGHDRTNAQIPLRGFFFGPGIERPDSKCAGLPCREEADRLFDMYFNVVNPQTPALHRHELEAVLDRTYSTQETGHSSCNIFFLFSIFATSASIQPSPHPSTAEVTQDETRRTTRPTKRQKLWRPAVTPEQYYASAMAHLERSYGLSSSQGHFNDLEELQVMIMLAIFALHRPTNPGLGRLVDVAMRTAIDLRLYSEHDTSFLSSDIDQSHFSNENCGNQDCIDDLRRRLWWCVYSLERFVAPYLGRPFFIPDEVITTEFPSLLDVDRITGSGFLTTSGNTTGHKCATHQFLKMRILQSEIHTVVQYQQALAKLDGKPTNQNRKSPPFLSDFTSFSLWRMNMNKRLDAWKGSILGQKKFHSRYFLMLLELEYWQAILVLYRWSINVPAGLVGCSFRANGIIQQLSIQTPEELDKSCLKVAEASQRILQIHRVLQNVGIANSAYLKTHCIFIAGSMFMFAFWNSQYVRSKLMLQDLDYCRLAATSALDFLIDDYPSAQASRDALEQMGLATVQMCVSAPDFRYTFLDPLEGSAFESVENPRQSSYTSPRTGQTPYQEPALDSEARFTPNFLLERRIDGSSLDAFSASPISDIFSQQSRLWSSLPTSAKAGQDKSGHLLWSEWLDATESCCFSLNPTDLSADKHEDLVPHDNDHPIADGLGLFPFSLGVKRTISDTSDNITGFMSNQAYLEPKKGPVDVCFEHALDSLEDYPVGWGSSDPTAGH